MTYAQCLACTYNGVFSAGRCSTSGDKIQTVALPEQSPSLSMSHTTWQSRHMGSFDRPGLVCTHNGRFFSLVDNRQCKPRTRQRLQMSRRRPFHCSRPGGQSRCSSSTDQPHKSLQPPLLLNPLLAKHPITPRPKPSINHIQIPSSINQPPASSHHNV
jgi:hypothetical protein